MDETTSSPPAYITQLRELVGEWASLGVAQYDDGTRLVGHLPRRGVGAYLHHLFGPLSEQDIKLLEDRLPQSLPASLREFYWHHNGCLFFGRSVFIFGLRRSYDRGNFDAMACNPWDIVIPTLTGMPNSPSRAGIVVSRYEDHSEVFIEPDGTVCRVLKTTPRKAVNRWPSLGGWLLSEYERLAPFFDKDGSCALDPLDLTPAYSIN